MRALLLTLGAFAALAVIFVILFTGGASRGGTFRAGQLWVRYEITSTGVMPERLEYAVISSDSPINQVYDGTEGTWQFSYTNGDMVTFKTRRGEILWIDESHKLQELGRVLGSGDIDLLQRRASEFKASSPDELLAFIKRSKTAPFNE